MLGTFRAFQRFWKPPPPSITKIILIILVFLFLGLEIWQADQVWQVKKQVNDLQTVVQQKFDTLQSNLNYQSSLLWALKGQLDQLPYQINVKK